MNTRTRLWTGRNALQWVIVAACLVGGGCDGIEHENGGIDGRWVGSYRDNEIEMDLVQRRSDLSGTGTWRSDGSVEVALALDGLYHHPDVVIEIESTGPPFVISGVFSGVVEDDRATMTGNFGGSQYLTLSRR